MRNKITTLLLFLSCIAVACEKKTEGTTEKISVETSTEIDEAISAKKISPKAKSAAEKITPDNVDAEADALLKEIENDKL